MVNEIIIGGDYYVNTATAVLADRDFYIPIPANGRIKEIVAGLNLAGGAANSGSVTINFYRPSSATVVASATTTGLLASGGISFDSGTTVGAITTATLNTSLVTGRSGGMEVSGGTTLLFSVNGTATTTVNGIFMRARLEWDD